MVSAGVLGARKLSAGAARIIQLRNARENNSLSIRGYTILHYVDMYLLDFVDGLINERQNKQ